MAHFFNRDSLIVIDDLERHSKSLSIRDILGVLTQLKEERGCQIIIVMNEDALNKDGDAPYFETKEKVIDRELIFQPTVEQAIAIGLSDYQGKNQFAAESCRKLNIANIRTIQKIDTSLTQLRAAFAEAKLDVPESFDQQLQTTVVLAVSAYWSGSLTLTFSKNWKWVIPRQFCSTSPGASSRSNRSRFTSCFTITATRTATIPTRWSFDSSRRA
jgi:hypothetical protein